MKFSKNILILIGSYLGVLILICCTAQFLVPLTAESPAGDGSQAGDALLGVADPDADTSDIAVGAIPEDEGSGEDSVAVTDPVSDSDVNGGGSAPDGDREAVYRVTTVSDGAVSVIAVYDGEGVLVRTLNTPLLSLPAQDRQRLESGIEVTGDEALAALVEDLGG